MASPFTEAFVRSTPLGVLAGVRWTGIVDVIPDDLHAEERAEAAALAGRRRTEWIGGRLAFWRAAAELGVPRGSLRTGTRGEPVLPAVIAGSISHKESLAVALVARGDAGSVGVDLEPMAPARPAIEDVALREDERAALRATPEEDRWERLLVAFTLKEALYKALHPHLGRYVRYDEAAVVFGTSGVPEIRLHLDGGAAFGTDLLIERLPDHLIACVRARGI